MKLTAELVGLSAQFINALKERELDLRCALFKCPLSCTKIYFCGKTANKIPAIENLGATMVSLHAPPLPPLLGLFR